jgi:hypothetical protein
VTNGNYKNLIGGWNGQVKVLGNHYRYTVVEDAAGDSTFTVSIFAETNSAGSFRAIMTKHSIYYGVSQLNGMCR